MTSPLDPGSYTSAAAFHAALEVRLRAVAGGDAHRWGLMRTQFAIARLLVRLQLTQPDEWITKGGTSMLARLDGRCRLSRDLDLQYRDFAKVGRDGLEAAIRFDANDWLRFRVEGQRRLRQEEFEGARFRISAWLGVKELTRFGVDVVDESLLSGRRGLRQPYSPVTMIGAPSVEVPLYPVEDHVADKVAAMGRVRRHGTMVQASTRYRDLADLALLAASLPVEARPLIAALGNHHDIGPVTRSLAPA